MHPNEQKLVVTRQTSVRPPEVTCKKENNKMSYIYSATTISRDSPVLCKVADELFSL